jgi:hypothetical protein
MKRYRTSVMSGCPERACRAAVSTAHLAYRKTLAHDPRFAEAGLMPSRLLILLVAAAMLLQTGVGYADAIDGDWCSTDGQHMTIHGDDITTPGGRQIKGNYSRHAFDYVVPAGEAGTGETVNILLRSEYLALSRQGPADAPTREWRRCANRTS